MVAYPFTPPPPALPQGCRQPNLQPLEPSTQWLEAYSIGGQPPAGGQTDMGNCCNNPPMPPAGLVAVPLGNVTVYDPSEVPANNGFEQTVPADEVWRLNWVTSQWITNTTGTPRYFIVRAFNNDNDMYYITGRNQIGDNSGGQISFMVNVGTTSLDDRFVLEMIPPDLFLWGGTTVIIQLANDSDGFMNSVQWNFDKWQLQPAAQAGGSGGGYFSGGPYFQLG